MVFGKFETYKFVELWSPFAFRRELNDSYKVLAEGSIFEINIQYPSKSNFVSLDKESTDALLRIADIVVFGKTEAVSVRLSK